MKKFSILFISIICIISLTACASNHLRGEIYGKTVIEMETDKNYDVADPFINARLFHVSEDIDVLETDISFQMDGESGVVEIKDNQTDETLWSNTWHGSVDNDTRAVSLENMLKGREYAIWFTGTKISHAMVKVTFQSDLAQEMQRPSI